MLGRLSIDGTSGDLPSMSLLLLLHYSLNLSIRCLRPSECTSGWLLGLAQDSLYFFNYFLSFTYKFTNQYTFWSQLKLIQQIYIWVISITFLHDILIVLFVRGFNHLKSNSFIQTNVVLKNVFCPLVWLSYWVVHASSAKNPFVIKELFFFSENQLAVLCVHPIV